MARSRSVAEARTQFTKLLRAVETGECVRITRRGRPVAVVVSDTEFQWMTGATHGLAEDYDRWRSGWTDEDRDLPADHFDQLRERSPGRDVRI